MNDLLQSPQTALINKSNKNTTKTKIQNWEEKNLYRYIVVVVVVVNDRSRG